MATYIYDYYETRIARAQRMRVESDPSTGDDGRIMIWLDFVRKYILQEGHRVGVEYAPPSAWTTRVRKTRLYDCCMIHHALTPSLCNAMHQFLSSFLSTTGVPTGDQPPIFRRMYDMAAWMTMAPAGDGTNLIHMELTVHAVTHVLSEDNSSPCFTTRPWNFQQPLRSGLPATRSSIEGLDEITVNDRDPIRECVICKEVISGGMDASRMPCSHVYHVECIEDWLEKSHRYAMPT
ncbi:hypothetical protein BT93_E0296 [Corymbia citriodora subsp. variegata]|nr:hypothetical protein BT93_E0296 [Corymbia citriodora subsp. variegata]